MSDRPPGLSPVVPSAGALAPVPAGDVRLSDAFRVAAGHDPGKALRGKLFTNADVYKLLEAFAWEVAQRPDPVREARLAELSGSDGHPEIEVGLMELYRATGQVRYLDQARRFVEQRGHRTFPHRATGDEYYLDDLPVREATVLRGHVVRAMYLTAGVVDLAVETGDDELLRALAVQWENTWARRTYLTGGMGAHHLGESFGRDFELPPDRAYCETCGAVGAVMVAWRLLLATGEAHYADAIERLLYNMIATSPSAEGDRFFYVNSLLVREPGIPTAEGEAPFRKDTLRANWFWVACCPTNVVRLLASLSGYVATVHDEALTLQQHVVGKVATHLPDGREVGVEVTTEYPWDGEVTVRVTRSAGRCTPTGRATRLPSSG